MIKNTFKRKNILQMLQMYVLQECTFLFSFNPMGNVALN